MLKAFAQYLVSCILGFFASPVVFNVSVAFGLFEDQSPDMLGAAFQSWFFGGSLWVLIFCALTGSSGFFINSRPFQIFLLWFPAIGPYVYSAGYIVKILS